jgi:RHS repeat-associated protein
MEKDDEVKGSGNHYTTHFRQYDPRLGRWFSVDPKSFKYPSESPYVAFHNNPITWTDPRGDDPPDLNKVLEAGMQSTVFKDLMIQTGITIDNIADNVSYGEESRTYASGKITLASFESIEKVVLELTHEMSNLTTNEEFNELIDQVRNGQFDNNMEEYARKAYQTEVKGLVNQTLVSLELGYGEGYSSEEQRQEVLQNYTIDETRNMRENFYEGEFENGTTTATGENIKDFYIRQGNELRQNELQNSEKNDSTKTE